LEGRGREGRGLEKRKEQVKEIDDIERRFWGFIFLHNTKSSSFGGNSKIVLEEGFGGFRRVYMNP